MSHRRTLGLPLSTTVRSGQAFTARELLDRRLHRSASPGDTHSYGLLAA